MEFGENINALFGATLTMCTLRERQVSIAMNVDMRIATYFAAANVTSADALRIELRYMSGGYYGVWSICEGYRGLTHLRGQRALIPWHMSREPSRYINGLFRGVPSCSAVIGLRCPCTVHHARPGTRPGLGWTSVNNSSSTFHFVFHGPRHRSEQ